MIENASPGRDCVQAVYEFLCSREENPVEMTQDEIKEALGLRIGGDGIGNCEQLLETASVLERLIASQNAASVRIDSDLPTLVDLLPKQARAQRKVLQAVERIIGARRQELVQFNLRDLSVNDDMDQASIAHALRELNRLETFTYVPPFRGRAIRMIRRDEAFDQLEIDFEAVERRKAAEYEKLDRIVRFAKSSTCRQQEILRYFGESDAAVCGHCDNCRLRGVERGKEGRGERGEGREERREESDGSRLAVAPSRHTDGKSLDPGTLRAVRIVLSGVARTQARVACGRIVISQMLCGSGSAKIKKLGLNRLSTFGLLKHLKQEEVLLLIDALTAVHCLQQTDVDRFRPVVELTEFGGEVMRGQSDLSELRLPAALRRKLGGKAEEDKPQGSSPKVQDSNSHYWTRRLIAAGFSIDECIAIRGLSREEVLEHSRQNEQE